MPEISAAEQQQFARYQNLGTPEELQKQAKELEKAKSEAAQARIDLKAVTEERDAFKAKVPAEDAIVLSGDEAVAYKAVQGTGLSLKDVDAAVKERDTLKARDAARTRQDSLAAAAKTEGWADTAPAALARVLRDDAGAPLPVEVKEEEREFTVNGRTEKRKMPVGYVTLEGKAVPFTQLPDVMPEIRGALLLSGGSGGGDAQASREVLMQRGAGRPAKADVFARVRDDTKAKYEAGGGPSVETLSKRLGVTST